jgi:putative ABC transport system substrate-binding protein
MKLYRAVLLLWAALVCGHGQAAAQVAATAPAAAARVGVLFVGQPITDTSPFGARIIRSFADHGYRIGRNLILVRRAANGQLGSLPQFVADMVASRVQVIIAAGYPAALAAKNGAPGIPVVVVRAGDPVADGLVASFARPGGNVTGVSDVASQLSVKRLQLLKEAFPGVRKVAMLWNADDLGMHLRYQAVDQAAASLGLAIESAGVSAPDNFATAFAAIKKNPPDAILMVSDILTTLDHHKVFAYAAAHRIPAMYEVEGLVRQGGLMSYGPDIGAMYDRAVGLAVQILHGAKPADLPLELPSRYTFAINLETARAEGLTIPRSTLVRADELIR